MPNTLLTNGLGTRSTRAIILPDGLGALRFQKLALYCPPILVSFTATPLRCFSVNAAQPLIVSQTVFFPEPLSITNNFAILNKIIAVLPSIQWENCRHE